MFKNVVSGIIDFFEDRISRTDDGGGAFQKAATLFQNYPNPFNPVTTIRYRVPPLLTSAAITVPVTLRVYDVLGRRVAELCNTELSAGEHSAQFDASTLASGTYYYELRINGYRMAKKMCVTK
jgi:hypothetical protein